MLIWLLLEVIAAAQIRSEHGGRLLAYWLRAATRPLVTSVQWVGGVAVDVSSGLRGMVALVAENKLMRQQLETARAENALLQEDLAALREAARLPVHGSELNAGSLVARCRFRSLSHGRMERSAGAVHAIRHDTPAVSADGLVGRVVVVESRRCWLELITHPAAAVAVRTEDGAIQGLAVGTGGAELEVEFIPRRARLLRGALLVTSGAEGVYPPGIAVARVRTLRESDSAFLAVTATPEAKLGSLRVVLLLPQWVRDHAPSGAAP